MKYRKEEDKKKIEDLEQEIKESKKKSEQLQSIVRAQETLLMSKKEEIEGLKHLSARKIQSREEEMMREREMEEKDNHIKELKKQVEDIDKKR